MSISPIPRMLLTPGKRIILFFCFTLIFFLLMSFVAGFVIGKTGGSTSSMRILAVMQDIMLFIVPALLTALMICRLPASLLAVDRKPDMVILILAVLTFVVSIPAMNFLISWNESIRFPEAWAGIEKALRAYEENAGASVRTLLGGTSVWDLVMGIAITGIAAGFSEELYFRGALQRIMNGSGVNIHIAIWIAAIIFSIFHMQFFGLVPRIVLGAFFGYLLFWCGSLWVPVIVHALNNCVYVVSYWNCGGNIESMPGEASGADYVMVAASLILTCVGLVLLARRHKRIRA